MVATRLACFLPTIADRGRFRAAQEKGCISRTPAFPFSARSSRSCCRTSSNHTIQFPDFCRASFLFAVSRKHRRCGHPKVLMGKPADHIHGFIHQAQGLNFGPEDSPQIISLSDAARDLVQKWYDNQVLVHWYQPELEPFEALAPKLRGAFFQAFADHPHA